MHSSITGDLPLLGYAATSACTVNIHRFERALATLWGAKLLALPDTRFAFKFNFFAFSLAYTLCLCRLDLPISPWTVPLDTCTRGAYNRRTILHAHL